MSKPDLPDRIDVVAFWCFPESSTPFITRVQPAHWATVFKLDEPHGQYRSWFVGPDGLTSIERELAEAKARIINLEKEIDDLNEGVTLPSYAINRISPVAGRDE